MTTSSFLNKGTHPHIATLILVTGLSALSMNIFLPSLPSISQHFGADKAVTQLAISLYLLSVAVLQPVLGPISDYYGRRPVVLLGLVGFFCGTLICVFAINIEMLLIGRMVQALSAAGMVTARAIVRDMVGREKAASMIGYVTMGMALAPMIGPAIGGFLDEYYGWQSAFWLLFVFGIVVALITWFDLGETRKSAAGSLSAQFLNYPTLLKSRRFWGYSLTASFCSGTFFSFLGGGPYVATEYFSLTPGQFGLFFAFISVGYMFGNYLSGRWSEKAGISRMMIFGNIVMIFGLMSSYLLLMNGSLNAYFFFGPLSLVGVGNGMTLPNANAGMVSIFPELAGAASGLGGFLQIAGGAAFSVLAGIILDAQSNPLPLLALMIVSALAGIFAVLFVIYIDRQEKPSEISDARSF